MIRSEVGGDSLLAIHPVDLQGDSSGDGLLGRYLDQRFRLDYLGIESGIFNSFNHGGGQLLRLHNDPSGVTHEIDHNIRGSIHLG